MTNRSNDDIANALRGLASGEHAEPERHDPATHDPATHAPSTPLGPASPVTPGQITPPSPSSKPAPRLVPVARPLAVPQPTAPARPPRPTQPSATSPTSVRPQHPAMAQASPSVARPPAYGAGPLRSSTAPANPTLATIPPQVAPPPPGSFAVTDPPNSESEDDAAIMPAPSVDYLAHVQHPAVKSGRSPARGARYRRTMIPVLLTLGGLMLVAAVLKYVVNPDAPLAMLPGWTAALLAVAGLALLVVAGLNMVLLRQIQPS